jgi:hypothetical protein
MHSLHFFQLAGGTNCVRQVERRCTMELPCRSMGSRAAALKSCFQRNSKIQSRPSRRPRLADFLKFQTRNAGQVVAAIGALRLARTADYGVLIYSTGQASLHIRPQSVSINVCRTISIDLPFPEFCNRHTSWRPGKSSKIPLGPLKSLWGLFGH